MKTLGFISLFVCLLLAGSLWGQPALGLQGRNRVVGSFTYPSDYLFGGNKLTGTIQGTDTADFYNERYIWVGAASLSKPNGDLLAYTNGYTLLDATGHIVPGADSLSPTPVALSELDGGNRTDQSALLLPKPGDTSEFRLVTIAPESWASMEDMIPFRIWLNRFKVTQTGDIVVLEKNRQLLSNTRLEVNYFSACRHGNGRDWWVFAKRRNSRIHERFLFTPDTILHDTMFVAGSILLPDAGRLMFSPNGQYAATWESLGGLRVFDFDRCQGTFNLLSAIPAPTFPPNSGNFCLSLCFSPQNQYIYYNTNNHIFRLPLQSNLQPSDVQLVRNWTFFQDTGFIGANGYYGMEPTLNGSIHISGTGTCRYYCTIANPDAASVSDVGYGHFNFMIPHGNNATFSNIPYHGLGAKVGSPCDTLSAITDVGKSGVGLLRLYPNPGAGQGTVLYDAVYGGGLLQVCSATGQEVHRQTLYPGSQQAEVQPKDALAPGVYSITLQAPQGGPSNRIKWVVTQP
jgi:hypothetical protein